MNNYFDKIYVITCKRCDYRQPRILSHFKEHNLSFEFVYSVDDVKFLKTHLTTTVQSLISGHLRCIEDAIDKGYHRILICEDDVNFIPNLNESFSIFIKNVKEWDFLQLGNQFWATQYLTRVKMSDNLYKFVWGTGSHCIALNEHIFQDTRDYLSLYKEPVDFAYYTLFKKYTAFCPEQFLADALSKNDHLGWFDSKSIFPSEIQHQ
jgi:hypothetical protein